jgi:hypothetical protein
MLPLSQIGLLILIVILIGGLANAMGRVTADLSIWLSVKFVAWVKKWYWIWQYRRRMAREAKMKQGIGEIVGRRQPCGDIGPGGKVCILKEGHVGAHVAEREVKMW